MYNYIYIYIYTNRCQHCIDGLTEVGQEGLINIPQHHAPVTHARWLLVLSIVQRGRMTIFDYDWQGAPPWYYWAWATLQYCCELGVWIGIMVIMTLCDSCDIVSISVCGCVGLLSWNETGISPKITGCLICCAIIMATASTLFEKAVGGLGYPILGYRFSNRISERLGATEV